MMSNRSSMKTIPIVSGFFLELFSSALNVRLYFPIYRERGAK